jgi:hypothetical protein
VDFLFSIAHSANVYVVRYRLHKSVVVSRSPAASELPERKISVLARLFDGMPSCMNDPLF